MIKKAFIVCLILFSVYTIFIIKKPMLSSSQCQWDSNIFRAQYYLYEESDTINDVIVGSSLSCRFVMDSLPKFYSLAFGGQSSFDGLRIIKKKARLPKNLYIETNVLLRKENDNFLNSLLSPILFLTAKHCISLRADKKPVPISSLYFNALRKIINKKIDTLTESKIVLPQILNIDSLEVVNVEENGITTEGDNEFFMTMLNIQINNYSKQPNETLLKEQLLLLSDYVKYFKEHGVNVYFFEMPVDKRLNTLPVAKTIRKELATLFPKNIYNYINVNNTEYETNDGLHLSISGAMEYTKYFKTQTDKIR
jgi:hypothetical protein